MGSETISKIDSIISRTNTHPEYSVSTARRLKDILRDEAAKHSYEIEYIQVRDLGDIVERRGGGVEQKTFNRLKNAWDHLAQNGLNFHSLYNLGHIIDPESNRSSGLRKLEVQFGGFAPPAPSVLPDRVHGLAYFLENVQIHPVRRAVNAHLDTVMIHPYEDGNGRAARLLQNFCLDERGYPSAIIPSTEARLYRTLIGETIKERVSGAGSWKDPGKAEESFVEYISSKILSSAQRLEQELKSKRAYTVLLKERGNPGLAHVTARKIRSKGRFGGNEGIKVSVDKKNGNRGESLTVIGDISQKDLNKILSEVVGRHSIKYSIDNNSC